MLNLRLYSCCNANTFADVATGEEVASQMTSRRLGFAVAAALKGEALSGLADDAKAFAQTIADTLKAAKNH